MKLLKTFFVAFFFGACICPDALSQNAAAPKATPPALKRYGSPAEVFDAYRQAIAKGDARTEYYCQVPELRGDAYQAYTEGFGFCDDKPEVAAVGKKFGVEPDVINAEYDKRYKQKHGASIEKLQEDYVTKLNKALAEYEKVHGKDPYGAIPQAVVKKVGLGPGEDRELMRKLVNEKVVNKDEFIIAMDIATQDRKNLPDPPGPLKNLRVNGDTAVGTTYQIVRGEGAEAGQPSKKFSQEIEYNIRFIKKNDGWLIAGPEPAAPIGAVPPPPPTVPRKP